MTAHQSPREHLSDYERVVCYHTLPRTSHPLTLGLIVAYAVCLLEAVAAIGVGVYLEKPLWLRTGAACIVGLILFGIVVFTIRAFLSELRSRKALAAAQEGLGKHPHSGESASMAFVVGLTQYLLQEYAAASAGFARYIEQFPDDRRAAEGHYYAGLSQQILGEYAVAAGWFHRLADRFAGSPLAAEGLFLSGENFYNALQFQQAYDAQAELLRRYPDSEYADDALYSAAWALFELKRLEEGVGQMRQLVSRFPDSPHAPRAQYTIGDSYYSDRNYRPAQEAYRQVVALFPKSPEAVRAAPLVAELEEQQANLLYEQAVAKYQQSDYQEAIRLYQSVAEQFPGTYSAFAALGNMGVALEELGDARRAAQTYRDVIAKVGADSTFQEVAEFARARLKHL